MPTVDPVISWFIALGGALLFGVAGAHKALHFRAFSNAVADYRVAPHSLTQGFAFTLIVLEGAVTLGLLAPVGRAAASGLAACLLAAYAVAMGVNLARGRRQVDCGCSIQLQTISLSLVARNVFLVLVFTLLSLLSASDRPLGCQDVFTVTVALVITALLYTSLGRLGER